MLGARVVGICGNVAKGPISSQHQLLTSALVIDGIPRISTYARPSCAVAFPHSVGFRQGRAFDAAEVAMVQGFGPDGVRWQGAPA
eukprot:5379239-Lingulodinium_polyedra.AAC.1